MLIYLYIHLFCALFNMVCLWGALKAGIPEDKVRAAIPGSILFAPLLTFQVLFDIILGKRQ